MSYASKSYPLLCSFRELVTGNGFVAEVQANGRALAEELEDGWWLTGVHPGGITEGGQTLREAHLALQLTFRKVMIDLSKEHADFASFERGVREFFETSYPEIAAEWQAALDAQRAGADGLPDLVKVKAEQWQPRLIVREYAPAPSSALLSDVPSMAA